MRFSLPLRSALAAVLLVGLPCACGDSPAGADRSLTATLADRPRASIPVREATLPEAVREFTLREAVRQGIVTVGTLDHNSERQRLALLLTPHVDNKPRIRIEPGWQTLVPEGSQQPPHVTYRTEVVELYAKNNLLVRVPHVQTRFSRFQSVPKGSAVAPTEDEDLLEFLHHVNASDPAPPWNVVQIAVWALMDDVAFEPVRKLEYGIIRGAAYNVISLGGVSRAAPSVVALDDASALLETIGRQRDAFRLWNEADQYLDDHIARYRELYAKGDRWAFSTFDKVRFFYPWDRAAEVLIAAFDAHRGETRETSYRRSAFLALSQVMDERAIAALQRAVRQEEDEKLRDQMREALEEAPRD